MAKGIVLGRNLSSKGYQGIYSLPKGQARVPFSCKNQSIHGTVFNMPAVAPCQNLAKDSLLSGMSRESKDMLSERMKWYVLRLYCMYHVATAYFMYCIYYKLHILCTAYTINCIFYVLHILYTAYIMYCIYHLLHIILHCIHVMSESISEWINNCKTTYT